MAEEAEGASPKEQILEACRRDNVDLFNEVLAATSKNTSKEKVAEFFNSVTDTMGNHLLHVCASYGSCVFAYLPCPGPWPSPFTLRRSHSKKLC